MDRQGRTVLRLPPAPVSAYVPLWQREAPPAHWTRTVSLQAKPVVHVLNGYLIATGIQEGLPAVRLAGYGLISCATEALSRVLWYANDRAADYLDDRKAHQYAAGRQPKEQLADLVSQANAQRLLRSGLEARIQAIDQLHTSYGDRLPALDRAEAIARMGACALRVTTQSRGICERSGPRAWPSINEADITLLWKAICDVCTQGGVPPAQTAKLLGMLIHECTRNLTRTTPAALQKSLLNSLGQCFSSLLQQLPSNLPGASEADTQAAVTSLTRLPRLGQSASTAQLRQIGAEQVLELAKASLESAAQLDDPIERAERFLAIADALSDRQDATTDALLARGLVDAQAVALLGRTLAKAGTAGGGATGSQAWRADRVAIITRLPQLGPADKRAMLLRTAVRDMAGLPGFKGAGLSEHARDERARRLTTAIAHAFQQAQPRACDARRDDAKTRTSTPDALDPALLEELTRIGLDTAGLPAR